MRTMHKSNEDRFRKDEDVALKSDIDPIDNKFNYYNDDDSIVTASATVTTTTITRAKFQRFRSTSRNKKGFDKCNEYEVTETQTEMTQTEMTQTQFTETEATATQTMNISNNANNAVIPLGSEDEIKCCHTIDIYTGLYVIFGYNALIALLLIAIIVILSTLDIAHLPSDAVVWCVMVWCVLFLCC
eukprot:120215_1